MRILIALSFVVGAACSSSAPKPEGPLVKEGSAVPDTCCCKSSPLTSEDGRPVYEPSGRMECSSKPGECVDDVQCNKDTPPPAAE